MYPHVGMVDMVLSIHNSAFQGERPRRGFLDVNYGDTPMHLVVRNGNYELMEILLKHNMNLKAMDKNRHTPIELAAILGRTEMIKCMLNYYDEMPLTEEEKSAIVKNRLFRSLVSIKSADKRELLILRSIVQLIFKIH